MITKWLLNGIYLVLEFLLSPFDYASNVALPDGLIGGLSSAWGYLMLANLIVPIDTLVICLAILLVFEVAIFGAKGIIFGIKKIPFIG